MCDGSGHPPRRILYANVSSWHQGDSRMRSWAPLHKIDHLERRWNLFHSRWGPMLWQWGTTRIEGRCSFGWNPNKELYQLTAFVLVAIRAGSSGACMHCMSWRICDNFDNMVWTVVTSSSCRTWDFHQQNHDWIGSRITEEWINKSKIHRLMIHQSNESNPSNRIYEPWLYRYTYYCVTLTPLHKSSGTIPAIWEVLGVLFVVLIDSKLRISVTTVRYSTEAK